jgi:hypothetical protein
MIENQSPTESRNFTEPEAAKHLKVSRITLQRRRLAGEIAFFRIGARVVYSTAHLDDFLARRTVRPLAQAA